MATVTDIACDVCGQRGEDLHELVVAYRPVETRPWIIDLCEGCYTRKLGPLRKVARWSPRQTARIPRRGFPETVLGPENL